MKQTFPKMSCNPTWAKGAFTLLTPLSFVLLFQACGKIPNEITVYVAPKNSEAAKFSSCIEIQSQMNTALNQFVNLDTQHDCIQDADCVSVKAAQCSPIVNKTAAQGYAEYLASTQYSTLDQQFNSLRCEVIPILCLPSSNPVCVQSKCVSKI